MHITKIQDLKRRLAECTDFGAFWKYYFDNFAEDDAFLNLGRLVTGDQLHEILAKVAARVLGATNVTLVDPRLVEQPESGLIHGSCLVNGKLMCILFFPDLDLGIAAVSALTGRGGVIFGRFSFTSPQAIAAAN